MNKMTLTAIATAISLAFGAAAMGHPMSKAEFKADKEKIETEYRVAKIGCQPKSGNAKDICIAEAEGREHVALAELEAAYRSTRKTRYDVRMARARADYSVAREKCDDQAGNVKDVCMKEAEAAQITAEANATAQFKTSAANKTSREKSVNARREANKDISDARNNAATDKRDADYAVAKEKCDALAGNARDKCVNDAKARFGKS